MDSLVILGSGAVGGLLMGIFTKALHVAATEFVTGYLGLRNARRHVLDMLVTETATAPGTKRGGVPGAYVVTAMRFSVGRATREALTSYLESAKRSPLRRRVDDLAVAALAPRLQFQTSEVSKVEFLAICQLIDPKKAQPQVEHYVDLTRDAVTEGAKSLEPGRAAAMGAEESAALIDQIDRVREALPARPRRKRQEVSGRLPRTVPRL